MVNFYNILYMYINVSFSLQVFVYNEHVIENGILPSLVDMFAEVANNIGDQVGYC